ncbi:transcriptional corepressor LEUNIG_HOMOLOG-like [Malus sylvestris]|uniref:transcriptional corepressor LEUNIG_HOMOLOG-like n=1 Tax=Malus sylvestris TaxID=3752 RepID=UPI0021AC00FC|nr:transcriptional corepressor LEUNIG_HOMOLOG-like [Malus sylvestris]
MPKSLMMYGLEGTGLAASSNLLDDIERFGDVGSLEDNVESFLSNDGGDRRDLYVTLKQSPKQRHKDSSKGFTIVKLAPVSSLFSDGKLLASAGHDKKACTSIVDLLILSWQLNRCLQAHTGHNSPIMSQ